MTPQNITLPALYVTRRDGQWFIRGFPELDVVEAGPYPTRRDAEEKRVGLLRTYRWGHLDSFWTCDRPHRKPTKERRRTHGDKKQPRPI